MDFREGSAAHLLCGRWGGGDFTSLGLSFLVNPNKILRVPSSDSAWRRPGTEEPSAALCPHSTLRPQSAENCRKVTLGPAGLEPGGEARSNQGFPKGGEKGRAVGGRGASRGRNSVWGRRTLPVQGEVQRRTSGAEMIRGCFGEVPLLQPTVGA